MGIGGPQKWISVLLDSLHSKNSKKGCTPKIQHAPMSTFFGATTHKNWVTPHKKTAHSLWGGFSLTPGCQLRILTPPPELLSQDRQAAAPQIHARGLECRQSCGPCAGFGLQTTIALAFQLILPDYPFLDGFSSENKECLRFLFSELNTNQHGKLPQKKDAPPIWVCGKWDLGPNLTPTRGFPAKRHPIHRVCHKWEPGLSQHSLNPKRPVRVLLEFKANPPRKDRTRKGWLQLKPEGLKLASVPGLGLLGLVALFWNWDKGNWEQSKAAKSCLNTSTLSTLVVSNNTVDGHNPFRTT